MEVFVPVRSDMIEFNILCNNLAGVSKGKVESYALVRLNCREVSCAIVIHC